MFASTASLVSGLVYGATLFSHTVNAGFFRMSCNALVHGRIDPIVSDGQVAGHVHKVSGGYNFDLDSDYDDLIDSKCTSCQLAADRSAYWTPLLYYQFPNGSFVNVPSGGHVVYYLGRGDKISQIQPFPKGFEMLSGNTFARSYDSNTLTWNGARPLADRVSYACLQDGQNYKETPNLQNVKCSNGMRAQIHFQSCWDGKNLANKDNSHVAYLSKIDNGACPPTHPVYLPHLFFEVYYSVNNVNQVDGGRFVFANGDATGYGFHGDFINGWDPDVQAAGVSQCVAGDNPTGQISKCAPLAAVDSQTYGRNCPERPPLVNEQIFGTLDQLPGCNPVTTTDADARAASCPDQQTPSLNYFKGSSKGDAPVIPTVGQNYNGFTYLGSVAETKNGRVLSLAKLTGSTMTVDLCLNFCDGKGYSLAGLEYGRECYCGNSLGANNVTADGSKASNSMICAGNSAQYCGGSSRLMVYQDNSS